MFTLNIRFRANRAWRRGVPVELSSVSVERGGRDEGESEGERGTERGGRKGEREGGGRGQPIKNDKSDK
jgi:hypothetical protein